VAQSGTRVVALVADGLGHGVEAAAASAAAVTAFRQRCQAPVEDIVAHIHGALLGTRGAALAVAEIDPGMGRVRFCGIGNIAARLLVADADKSLISQFGIAGYHSPKIRAYDQGWHEGALLVMHSDGLASSWDLRGYLGLLGHHPQLAAATVMRDAARANDDALVLALRDGRRGDRSHDGGGPVRGDLLRLPLETSRDVAVSRQLTRDVAREAGMASLEQAKLATVVAGLARRCLAGAGAGEVVFSVEGTAGDVRLVVAVSDAGTGTTAAGTVSTAAGSGRGSLGLDLHSLRRLVDDFEQAAGADGRTRVKAAVRLSAEVATDPGLLRRLRALRPVSTAGAPSPEKVKPIDVGALLEAQSKQLEQAMAELARANRERDAVNAELALTNRGVLDLVAELSDANESLTVSGARYRQLADQQSALADLGHRAVASHNIKMLAMGLVGILRGVLGVQTVGVLRFTGDTPTLEIVASDGCDPDLPATISVSRRQARNLRREETLVADLTDERV
jgi:anti-sigma regulatory factor (Ser/Thr protein kinase)